MTKNRKIYILLSFAALFFVLGFFTLSRAATNIDSVYKYAWNDNLGWLDFGYTNNVNVYSDRLEGYASSSTGYIALNCNSTPNGNICATSNFKVSNNGSGLLAQYAWNDAIGWISFSCTNTSTCAASNYQVSIDAVTGDFSGWAWNDVVGWISFNCSNIGSSCSTSNYKLRATLETLGANASLISATVDTGVIYGATFNTFMWKGNLPNGTSVMFQLATANCYNGANNPPACNYGNWVFKGPDGTSNTFYNPGSADKPININSTYHNNQRYFRYKIFLVSDSWGTISPRVDDVIINWSP